MKKAVMILAVMLAAVPVTAQTNKEKFTVTPRAGITLSDYETGNIDNLSPGIGLGAGVEIEAMVSPLAGISLGVFYQSHTVKDNTEGLSGSDSKGLFFITTSKNGPSVFSMVDKDQCVDYSYSHDKHREFRLLSIPLMVNMHVWKGLTLKGGLQLDCLTRMRDKETLDMYNYNLLTGEDKEHPWGDVTMHKDVDAKDKYHDIWWSIPLGAAYEYKNIELDVRYLLGTEDITRTQNTFNTHGKKSKTKANAFLLTLGYKFHL